MKYIIALLLLIVTVPPVWSQPYKNSVVKLNVTSQAYDFSQPWQKMKPEKSSGSGCIIDGNRILTCAHVVEFGTFIEVRKGNENKKYTATVAFIAPEYDLAVLEVKDDNFFDDANPFPIGGIPNIGDQVTALGFPRGGTDLSITSGIVSRIETIDYSYDNFHDLGIQIDAAINPGNSGGPVLVSDTLAGIAFQGLSSGQSIGYMIPTTIIKTFLRDIADGTYDGPVPVLFNWQSLENEALRNCFGLPDTVTGVLINRIHPESALADVVQPNDILLAIDSIPVYDNGDVYLSDRIKTNFETLLQNKVACDTVTLSIRRHGTDTVITEALHYNSDPKLLVGKVALHPKYLIQDGFVLTTPSYYYFRSHSFWQYYYPKLSYYYYGRVRTSETHREIVMIASVLPNSSNVGYHNVANRIVAKINTYPIRDFDDAVAIFQKPSDYYVIEDIDGNKYVIDGKRLEKNNKAILEKYGIAEQMRK